MRITESELADVLLNYTPRAYEMAHGVFTSSHFYQSASYTSHIWVAVNSTGFHGEIIMMHRGSDFEPVSEETILEFDLAV